MFVPDKVTVSVPDFVTAPVPAKTELIEPLTKLNVAAEIVPPPDIVPAVPKATLPKASVVVTLWVLPLRSKVPPFTSRFVTAVIAPKPSFSVPAKIAGLPEKLLPVLSNTKVPSPTFCNCPAPVINPLRVIVSPVDTSYRPADPWLIA